MIQFINIMFVSFIECVYSSFWDTLLKICKSPGTDQFPAKLIQAGDNILRFESHKVIYSI